VLCKGEAVVLCALRLLNGGEGFCRSLVASKRSILVSLALNHPPVMYIEPAVPIRCVGFCSLFPERWRLYCYIGSFV